MSEPHAPSDSPAPHPAGDGDVNILAFPASPAQEAFFYLEKLFPSHPAFNVPVRFELKGVLDRGLLKSAFDALAERHEGLRTRFVEEDGKLLQVIASETTFPLPCTDISHLAGSELEAELNRLGSEEARTAFDMSKDPLFRASLILTAPDRHILQITIHHSVADGWSIGIMTDELAEFYNASLENREPRVEPLAIQYADFTIWQREFLESPELNQHLEHWKKKLQGYTELELPTDRPRPPLKSWDGDIVSLILRPSISEKVARISRDKGATMFHVFLAAFKAVASRYTGLEDIAVGSPVAGRTRAELEPIIGTFINSVILRTDLSGDPSFGELVGRVRDNVTDAIAHQDLPFEQLVKALQPRRDPGRNPLFQINFTHQRDFVKPVSFGGAHLTAIPSRSPGAIFDLHFFMVERADGWRASCDFARDLFDRSTAERLLRHFETFLDAAAGEPDVPLSQLPILTSAEKIELTKWSGAKILYPSDRSLGELFLDQAARQPARIALTHAKRDISYQLLAASALGLRSRLIQSGVKPGSRVALCAPSVPEMISAQIAILLAGASCVPLDPDYPADRLKFMLEDSASTVILTTSALSQKLPDSIGKILLTPLAESLVTPALAEVNVPADSVSHVFYTSGSTGTPKGVMVGHRGISRLVLGGGFMDFKQEDSFLQTAPISFDAATLEIWMPLLHGGRIVLTGESGPSLPAIARAIREQGVTCLWLTAGLFQTMVDEHLTDLKGLRYLLAGGDVLSPDHVRRAFEALSNTTLINGYGPTENTTFTCCHTITRSDLDRSSIPIGRPVGNTTVHVLDARMRPVPIGIPGELFTGGDGLALGYLGNDELTASKFPIHPELGRLYRTGDLCRWLPDGSIEFLGRSDTQVKIRGFRIEPGEIEARLASHPGVKQAKVAVRGNSAESKRIEAWVVPAEGTSPDPAELSDYLTQFLPGYMRPDGIAIIDVLPLSANGKVDVSGLPDPSRPSESRQKTGGEAPVGKTEQRLAVMWSDLLEVPQVHRDDDFFALGGHSLMALRLFSRINREFNLTLPLAALLSHPTLRELATLVGPAEEPEIAPKPASPTKGHFVTLSRGTNATPLFCIHGGDGGVLFYRSLAALMPADLPFHAIESLELGSSGKIESSSIEETATAYLHILLESQSQGPFRLAGYSFGGVVAHEMACQLERLGHKVEFLGLFDTHNPTASARSYSMPERLRVFWQQNSEIPFWSRIKRVRQRFGEGVRTNRRIKTELKAARSSGPAEPYSDLRRVQVREENWRAMQAYRPGAFKGRITLFKTSTISDKVERPADYGWGPLATGGLDIASVSGEHLTLFEPENISSLGEALVSALAQSRS
ncbi:MAG: amino acid adenylation domain-containing protein [Luteolibacter sp.]|uniref:non-ribosomal peptide synthetase n=1 Tax=Luteolibacter sp. TaxID=1962973 RepID=UPI003267C927